MWPESLYAGLHRLKISTAKGCMCKNLSWIIKFYFLVPESLLLRMVRVTVPSYRVRGQPAQLDCDYDLGNDALYSVKWYRDNEEFYRYMPKFDPPKHAYKIDGIKVDVSILILYQLLEFHVRLCLAWHNFHLPFFCENV